MTLNTINKILAIYTENLSACCVRKNNAKNLFNLKAKKILARQKGYRNQVIPIVLTNNQKICLIVYKNEQNIVDKIKAANLVSNFLAGKGFPTRQTLTDKLTKKFKQRQLALPKIIKFSTPTQTRYACFYTYLPGKTICWENYTQKHLKLLGKAMALMHQALAKIDANAKNKVSLPLASSILKKQIIEMRFYFKQTKTKNALAKKLGIKINSKIFDQFTKLNLLCKKLPSLQVLHLDFVRSNLLFDKGDVTLTGILDFEKTAIGNPVLDIARTLAFLLVDCKYKTQKQIIKYFLRSGYQKRGGGKLSKAELKLLLPLINYFLFYDFYKFLKHNPYESLEQNEHWKKTRERLEIGHLSFKSSCV